MEHSIIAQEKRWVAHHYAPLPVVLARGEGVYVWDTEGTQYLDFVSAYSAVSHGHCHPRLLEALHSQSQCLTLPSRAFYHDKLAAFAQRLCELSAQDQFLPMNTGAEAVETALKAARKWAYTVKGVEAECAEIIACDNNFHGRTLSIVGLSSEEQYRNGFGPFPPGLKRIAFGDSEALERAITKNTAAFLVEPIQGEGGINLPPEGYLKRCADICRKHNVLLICDEVQTGLARTGRLFAYEHSGIKPDGLILGKALGGGLLPVSGFLTRKEVMDVFTPGDHGSTFGGNPLACAVGLCALDIIEQDNYCKRSRELGEYLLHALQAIKSPLIKEVRGQGLFIGLEVDPALTSAKKMSLALLEKGLLTKDTHHTVLRFAPPLVITQEHIDQALDKIRAVFC